MDWIGFHLGGCQWKEKEIDLRGMDWNSLQKSGDHKRREDRI